MKVKIFILLTGVSVLTACSSSMGKKYDYCGDGRTSLDGTCVTQSIADYASCVRSQSVELVSEDQRLVSSAVNSLKVGLSAAYELSEKLNKKYSASDEVMSKIIHRCDLLSGILKTPNVGAVGDNSSPSVLSENRNQEIKSPKDCYSTIKTFVPDSTISAYVTPSRNSQVRRSIKDGSKISILRNHNEGRVTWSYIGVGSDKVGWIQGKYISNACSK